jgi:periplasmic protein TonB
MTMETGTLQFDSFDLLLNDVLNRVANPEMPERLRVNLQTRVWMQRTEAPRTPVISGTTLAGPHLVSSASARVPAFSVGSEEESMIHSLWMNLRDVFFPAKLPALVLESKPIAIVDRMKVERDRKSTGTAILLHAAILALIFWVSAHKIASYIAPKTTMTEIAPPPPMAPPKATAMGGGGGQRGPTPVTKGEMPKFAENQMVPPKAPPMQEPKITIQPTIEVQKDLKMADSKMPNLGMPSSPLIGTSMGNGSGTGLGSGRGSGLGAGEGGNFGGGLRHIGGGVSAPILIHEVEPEFSEEARKAKAQGIVTVNLWVGPDGVPSHVRVVQGVGMGLDQKAIEAVKQYKFKPAMEGGKPVTVELNVAVNFQIF